VDRLDLLQLHSLVDPIEWEIALGPGGALEAAVRAREEGLVRYIGVTGHGATIAAMHRRSLERFPFDSVLLPYNYVARQLPHHAEDFDALAALCRERHVACQTIQGVARRPWPAGPPHARTPWYEPLTEQEAIARAVHWVLSHADLFLISPSDGEVLPHLLRAAGQPAVAPSDEEMRAQVAAQEMRALYP
jgi:aryl-alcohol dehydrogenase-like predicted oxidoreductase